MSLNDKPNIHTVDENRFRSVCEYKHLEICDEYELVIDENEKLISWKLNKHRTKVLIEKKTRNWNVSDLRRRVIVIVVWNEM
jgi:hypothetical protein